MDGWMDGGGGVGIHEEEEEGKIKGGYGGSGFYWFVVVYCYT